MPGHQFPEDPGYSPTYRSDWHARKMQAMRDAKLGPTKVRRNEVGAAYGKAVKEFAAVKAANLTELLFKVETGLTLDCGESLIARSVLFDIARLGRSGDFRYEAKAVEVSA